MLGLDTSTTVLGGTGIVGLLSINFGYSIALLKSYRGKQHDQDQELIRQGKEVVKARADSQAAREETQKVKEQHFACEQRINILVWTLQTAGIKVPEAILHIGNESGGPPHD